jgi:transcription elongation factor GreB
MSRAFTREDSWEDPIIPPRPPLPDGMPNYVTPRGLTLLREEQARLEGERARLEGSEEEARASSASCSRGGSPTSRAASRPPR